MATCKGCGKEIIWAVTEDGKRLPLDPVPAVYRLDQSYDDHFVNNLKCQRDKNALVSHFITCPKRDDFSSNNKQKDLL